MNMNITFGQMIDAKRKCERRIVDALSDMIKETGLRVDELRLEPIESMSPMDITPKAFLAVKLIVRLP